MSRLDVCVYAPLLFRGGTFLCNQDAGDAGLSDVECDMRVERSTVAAGRWNRRPLACGDVKHVPAAGNGSQEVYADYAEHLAAGPVASGSAYGLGWEPGGQGLGDGGLQSKGHPPLSRPMKLQATVFHGLVPLGGSDDRTRSETCAVFETLREHPTQ